MRILISFICNMDNCCVKLKFTNRSMVAIDTIGYADLILNSNPETYLKTVTEYKTLDS